MKIIDFQEVARKEASCPIMSECNTCYCNIFQSRLTSTHNQSVEHICTSHLCCVCFPASYISVERTELFITRSIVLYISLSLCLPQQAAVCASEPVSTTPGSQKWHAYRECTCLLILITLVCDRYKCQLGERYCRWAAQQINLGLCGVYPCITKG